MKTKNTKFERGSLSSELLTRTTDLEVCSRFAKLKELASTRVRRKNLNNKRIVEKLLENLARLVPKWARGAKRNLTPCAYQKQT